MDLSTLGREIIRWGRHLWAAGLVRGTSGNLSHRAGQGILITGAGSSLAHLSSEDLVFVPFKEREHSEDGHPVKPSSETGLHQTVYLRLPWVRAVVHAHCPYATGLAGLMSFEPEGVRVGCVDRLAPGGQELARACGQTLESGVQVVLMKGHGVLAPGKDLQEAVSMVELVEEAAQIAFIERTARLGGDKGD